VSPLCAYTATGGGGGGGSASGPASGIEPPTPVVTDELLTVVLAPPCPTEVLLVTVALVDDEVAPPTPSPSLSAIPSTTTFPPQATRVSTVEKASILPAEVMEPTHTTIVLSPGGRPPGVSGLAIPEQIRGLSPSTAMTRLGAARYPPRPRHDRDEIRRQLRRQP
jgi:hypothetical protein